ncbi:leucyl aminopeptidase [Rickettsiales bacterium]|nr:leucyl aminopeptidase [Rickettsiales bacterium]
MLDLNKLPSIKLFNDTKLIDDPDVIVVLCGKDSLDNIKNGNIDCLSHTSIQQEVINKEIEDGFDAKLGSAISIKGINKADKKVLHVLFIGVDQEKDNEDAIVTLSKIISNGVSKKHKNVVVMNADNKKCELDGESMKQLATLIGIQVYEFNKYITDEKRLKKSIKIENIFVQVQGDVVESDNEEINNVVEATRYAKDLINMPPNDLNPSTYVDEVKNLFDGIENVNIKVLGVDDMKKLGMNMLLGVGMGSDIDSKVVLIEYKGDESDDSYKMSFVGKGVTFDSGGLSLKPANSMMDMKCDMSGSATVVGSIYAISKNKIKKNVVGIIGLVENSINGSAQRPGDIVKSMSGKTVEVLNTDAEGRLVLGDIMTYVQQEYKPEYMIDLATLTGAIMVALGYEYAGIFSNSDELCKMLETSSKNTYEKIWRMPMNENYDKMINSDIADMKNISNTGLAGATTAAQFLKRFVEEETKWCHIDIAGTAFGNHNKKIPASQGATGYGVRMLHDLIKNV